MTPSHRMSTTDVNKMVASVFPMVNVDIPPLHGERLRDESDQINKDHKIYGINDTIETAYVDVTEESDDIAPTSNVEPTSSMEPSINTDIVSPESTMDFVISALFIQDTSRKKH